MTNRAQMSARRVAAGERYAAALNELFSAMVDLAAFDRCLSASSFSHDLQDLPTVLEHPVFAPRVARRLADEIRVAADEYAAALTRAA